MYIASITGSSSINTLPDQDKVARVDSRVEGATFFPCASHRLAATSHRIPRSFHRNV